MDKSSTQSGWNASHELRFAGLFDMGRGYAFPCDAEGHVDIDRLGELARVNYFYARAMVGRELFAPVTCAVPRERG
jgi:hypothetical protein